jgi:hypothetical protein
MFYLGSCVRVMDARVFEQSSVCHDGRLFMTHIHSQSTARNLFAINTRRKVIDIVMAEVVRVRVDAAEVIRVLYHGK